MQPRKPVSHVEIARIGSNFTTRLTMQMVLGTAAKTALRSRATMGHTHCTQGNPIAIVNLPLIDADTSNNLCIK